MADLPGIRCAVYPIVRYVDPHPYNPHRIVWTRCDLHQCICGIGVPEQVWVVVVDWMSPHLSDLPMSDGERVVGAAAGYRRVENDLAFLVIHRQARCALRDNDLRRLSTGRRGTQHVGDADVLSGRETGAGVQALEQSRRRVE